MHYTLAVLMRAWAMANSFEMRWHVLSTNDCVVSLAGRPAHHQLANVRGPLIEDHVCALRRSKVDGPGGSVDASVHLLRRDEAAEQRLGALSVEVEQRREASERDTGVVLGDYADVLRMLEVSQRPTHMLDDTRVQLLPSLLALHTGVDLLLVNVADVGRSRRDWPALLGEDARLP